MATVAVTEKKKKKAEKNVINSLKPASSFIYKRCISIKAVPLLPSRMAEFPRSTEHN